MKVLTSYIGKCFDCDNRKHSFCKELGREIEISSAQPIDIDCPLPDKEEGFCEWKINEFNNAVTSCGRKYHLPTRIATYANCKSCGKPIKEVK